MRQCSPIGDLRVHAIGSGSSGNAMLVQAGATNVLIDAGVRLKPLAAALARCGVPSDSLDAILITHEHADHMISAAALSRRTDAPLVTNRATLDAVLAREETAFETRELPTGDALQIGEARIRSFPISHDAAEPVGFVIEYGAIRIAYATDVGRGDDALHDALKGASLVVLESNHDADWLQHGPYPREMKARVASSVGHLSNHECAEILAARAEEGGPFCAWLAHLSRVNNSPALARRTVTAEVAERTRTPIAIEVALRDHPSVSWRSGVGAVQLSMF